MALCGVPQLPGLLQEAHQEAGDAATQGQQRPPQQQQRPEAEQQPGHRPPAAALEALQERSRQALVVMMSSAGWTSAHVAPDVAPDVAPGSTLCFAVCCMSVGREDVAKKCSHRHQWAFIGQGGSNHFVLVLLH